MRRFQTAFLLAIAPMLVGIVFAQPQRTVPQRTIPPRNGTVRTTPGRTASVSGVRLSDVPTYRKVPRRGQRPATSSTVRTQTQTRTVQGQTRSFVTTVGVAPPAVIDFGPVQQRWQLGVQFELAPMGVRVTGVLNGGPAQRLEAFTEQGVKTYVPLEPGDYIVDINAHRVGYCPEKQAWVDFEQLLNFEANNPQNPGDYGWVNIGVFDMRSHQTLNFWVQLQPRR